MSFGLFYFVLSICWVKQMMQIKRHIIALSSGVIASRETVVCYPTSTNDRVFDTVFPAPDYIEDNPKQSSIEKSG
jgi:hypothetical protein